MGSSTWRPRIRQHRLPSATPTATSATPRVLPANIALVVLKLNRSDPTVSLSDLRVVSKQFDDPLVPIHHLTPRHSLNPGIVACFQHSEIGRAAAQLKVAKDIRTHTRHVSIDIELSWPLVLELLYSLEDLRELRYATMLCTATSGFWDSVRAAIWNADWLARE